MGKTDKLRRIVILSAVVAVICLIAALGLLYFSLNAPVTVSSGLADRPAPDFSLPSLNRQNLSLSALRGKPVIINFWAVWCYPCIAEMPLLEETAQKYADDGLVVIGINQGDSFAEVEEFAAEQNLTFPLLVDEDESVGSLFKVNGYPTSIFIDKDGMIRAVYLGEIPQAQLKANLRLIGIR